MHESVNKIKDGDFDVRSDIQSRDEIGEMSDSVNAMASHLKESYRELEQRVEEKTKDLNVKLEELEKLNSVMVGRELKMIELKKGLGEKESQE